jgi:FAD/FMN-containing dehydrogenase
LSSRNYGGYDSAVQAPKGFRGRFLDHLAVRAAYSEGAGIYRIPPAAVALPADRDDLVTLVRWAGTTRTPLVPRGAGSGMPGGNVGPGVVVDLTYGFRGPVEIADPLKARVPAGRTAAELAAVAKPLGARLPVDPSSMEFCTLGGMAATNAAGPRSRRYGSIRRWIEGVEVVFANGTVRWLRREPGAGSREPKVTPWRPKPETRTLVAQRFPKTRKNSSGYALDAYFQSGDEVDLLVGSEGTLGFITTVETRLDPIPPDAGGLLIGLADLDDLPAAVTFLDTLNPSAVELLDRTFLDLIRTAAALDLPPAVEAVLIVEFERDLADLVRRSVREAAAGTEALAAHVEVAVDRTHLERLFRIRQMASPVLARMSDTRRSLQIIEDGCVPLDGLSAYIAGVREASRETGVPVAIFGHAGDGHVHVNAQPDVNRPGWQKDLRRLFEAVTALLVRQGGTPSGEHGDGRLRSGVLAQVFGDELVQVFADVKRAYDPLGILNPGVIIPAPDWDPLRHLKVGSDAAPIPDPIAQRLREVEQQAGWGIPKTELTG